MIKQPGECCCYCGKIYKKKTNLEKHVNLCELLNNSKKPTKYQEDKHDIPSQRKIYEILLELGNKFNRLNEKVDELNKWVIKKKKKINVIEWLNENIKPSCYFDDLNEKINIVDNDVQILFEYTFYDTLNHIFTREIYDLTDEENPLFASVQKINTFYVYDKNEEGWIELNKEKLINFLNKIYMKLFRMFINFKKTIAEKISKDDKFSILCDKTCIKLTNIDFNQETILGKIRSNMYNKIKKDVKIFIDYEFEI